MRQRLPHQSPVHPVPAGQRPDRQPLPPRITPDALEQLSLRGRHQTLLTPRSTTRLRRATRPAGPLQADIRIPSPAPSPGGARSSRPSGAKSSRRSQSCWAPMPSSARAPGPEDNDISPRRTEAGDRAGKALPAWLVRQRDAIAARRQRSPTPTAMVFAGLRRLSPRQINEKPPGLPPLRL